MAGDDAAWMFCDFGLLVTGEGERDFLPRFLRVLARSHRCTFRVLARIPQLSPITSPKRILRIPGTNKAITDKDFELIAPKVRGHLNQPRASGRRALVILIDDLEHDRASQAGKVFERYREALDKALNERKHLASVHFLVNMLEAYYFAHAEAINAVLGTKLVDYSGDVEAIRHPKNDLKAAARSLHRSFDEVEDGEKIIELLDLTHVLSRPHTCASLRTLFGWCKAAMGDEPTEEFCLASGVYSDLTKPQVIVIQRTNGPG